MKSHRMGLAVLAALAALPGCRKEEAAATASQAPSQEKQAAPVEQAPAPLTGGGTVRGTITFTGEVPAAIPIEPVSDPACQGMALEDQAVQVKDGRLANVLVRVQGPVPGAYPAPKAAILVDQKQCTYAPRVQGVVAGQPILIRNGDGTLHNVRGVSEGKSLFNVAQPPQGRPVEKPLPAEAQVVRLKCDIHPWMVAWVVSSPHPFFSTTGADGAFTLEHVPAGTWTLEAWHEKLGTKTVEVKVEEGKETAVDFAFAAAK